MSRTEEPLLEGIEAGAESLRHCSSRLGSVVKVAGFPDSPCSLTIDGSDDSIKLEYEAPVSKFLPGFEFCAPRKKVVDLIRKEDLIGYESKPVGAEMHLRLLYMPLTRVETTKPVRKLIKTPWLVVDPCDGIDAHVGRCVPKEKKRILVIVNPKSGKGDADMLVVNHCIPILEASGARVDKRVTEAPHHATEIMLETEVSQYDIILSAGGDGTFHEILQGLLRRDDWKNCTDSVSLMQVPCGSGNALAASSGIWDVATAAYVAIKGRTSSIDVATIIQPSTNTIMFSFLSVTFGLIANLDIGTEHLRWMGGQRFIWGAIKEILSQRVYACRVSYIEDDASSETTEVPNASCNGPPLQYLGPLVSDDGTCRDMHGVDNSWQQVSGDFQLFSMSNLPWLDMNFNLHPHARMSGGSYNFLYCLGRQGIMKGFQLMTDSEKGLHMHLVEEKHIKAFRIDPVAENTWLVIDGEAIDRAPVYGEVHPRLLSIVCPP